MNTIILIIVLLLKFVLMLIISAFTEETESRPKAPFAVETVRITEYKHVFSKGYTRNWLREMFVIDSLVINSPWTYKIKDLNNRNLDRNIL